MIKENKKKLILTSVIIVLPIIAGLLLWNKLPDQVPTHWNTQGEVNGWSSKAFAVFGLPVFLFGIHWLCLLAAKTDPKRRNYSEKMWNLVLWICPVVSIFTAVLVYGASLGMEFQIDKFMPILMGVTFIIIGNYMPKCKQNYTLGIKLPWTLNDEENWNYTHRLAGKVWVVGGILFMGCVFLPVKFLDVALIAIILILTGIPVVWSYLFYKKDVKSRKSSK